MYLLIGKKKTMIKTEKKEFVGNDRYRFSNGKTSYDYEKERVFRLKERKRVNKILSYALVTRVWFNGYAIVSN